MFERIRKARQEEQGFTLIELLIVIVILGILAAIVVFAVGGITDRGTNSACKADYKTIQTAEEAYFAQPGAGNGSYGTVAQLVSSHLLAAPSKLHDATGGATYTITDISGSNCNPGNDT